METAPTRTPSSPPPPRTRGEIEDAGGQRFSAKVPPKTLNLVSYA